MTLVAGQFHGSRYGLQNDVTLGSAVACKRSEHGSDRQASLF
jgi:hypothetical protein